MLISEAQTKAGWREQKTEEYPHDTRNARSAAALRTLAKNLSSLPSDHPKLREAWRCLHGLRSSTDPDLADDAEPFVVAEQELFRTYGFHRDADGDAIEFLDQYISEMPE